MGAPNNPDKTVEQIFADLIRDPMHQLSEDDLHDTGMDIGLLEAMFENDVRPYLDYLADYKPLEELPPIRPRDYDWPAVLARFGQLGQHRQALLVCKERAYCYKRGRKGPEELEIVLYLTREGRLILWHTEGSSERNNLKLNTQQVRSFRTIREACRALQGILPDEYTISWRNYGRRSYFPLLIEDKLRHILSETISLREKRLDDMREALARAGQRISCVQSARP